MTDISKYKIAVSHNKMNQLTHFREVLAPGVLFTMQSCKYASAKTIKVLMEKIKNGKWQT